MSSFSDEGYEDFGKTARVALGIDDKIKPDPIDFLRRLKHVGYIKDYIRLPDAALPDREAFYNPSDNIIYLRDTVCRGAENGVPHFQFTVFHEGAHALLGHQHERKRSFAAKAQSEKRVASIRNDEKDADGLAAAIMAPLHKAEFNLETTPDQIATRFNLSPSAAAIRRDTFARMYRKANNIRRPLPKGVADFLTEQRRRGYVVTSLPAEEIAAIKPIEHCYTGDACPNPACGHFKMVRSGTLTRCEVCGCITGDE